jgi:ferritin-like metal-binding protein YciE
MKDMKKEKSDRTMHSKARSSDEGAETKASRKRNTTGEMEDEESSEEDRSNENSELLEFFVDELKDIYWAEKHLVKSLPKMAKAATSEDLRGALEDHLAVTEEHVSRLEEVFSIVDKKPQAKKCDAMAGLVEEANGIVEETEDGSMTRDVGLIFAAQKVEHYEMATYGCLRTIARVLGYEDAATLLQTTLDEEGDADKTLTAIAESYINEEASKE